MSVPIFGTERDLDSIFPAEGRFSECVAYTILGISSSRQDFRTNKQIILQIYLFQTLVLLFFLWESAPTVPKLDQK